MKYYVAETASLISLISMTANYKIACGYVHDDVYEFWPISYVHGSQ